MHRGCRGRSSGRCFVGYGGLSSPDGASETVGLVASTSGCSVFLQQRRWLSCWGFMAETMVMLKRDMGGRRWWYLAVGAVKPRARQRSGFREREAEENEIKMQGRAGRSLKILCK